MEQITLKSGETLVFRAPTVDDAQLCLEYLACVASETDFLLANAESIRGMSLESEAAFLRARIENPNDMHLLGFVNGELATMFNIECSANPRLCHTAEVAIAIRKAYWGKGIGTLAFERMLCWAREHGIRMVRLSVFEKNMRAQALYRKMGFRECGRYTDAFFVGGAFEDEILMERRV